MDSKFAGIVKETIESEVGKPAVVTVEFALDTEDITVANIFLDGIKNYTNQKNEELEFYKIQIPGNLREGAKKASHIKYE